MSRRVAASSDPSQVEARERSNSNSSAGTSSAPSTSAPQFVPLHSRVGWRYQASIPKMLAQPADTTELQYKTQALQQPRRRFSPDSAAALGPELDKYLKLARSLRDGATFDSQEQVETLALQHLHRFQYNVTDAACSLYARHTIELPGTGETQSKTTAAEEAKKWLLQFYRCMQPKEIDEQVLKQMQELNEKARKHADAIPQTEAGVLRRLVTRVGTWREQCGEVEQKKVDRSRLLKLLYEAEDLQVNLPERKCVADRLRAFDSALTKTKRALEHTSKRNNKKVRLEKLAALFEQVMAPNLIFPEEVNFRATLEEANDLKSSIENMLVEDKVSLPLIRDVLAKIELVPINFEAEVDQLQKKMLNAQTWLAKARKCMPNRRATRRGGGGDTKKMDLGAIRALVDDAPCEDSTEMFEMQDLLECADEWSVKVMEAIDGGADVSMERLRELLDEAKDIPVVMEEQKYLEAEIFAREWCTTAGLKLASRKSIEEMEELLAQAKEIREHIHPKKQSRWKPQVERDINAGMDQARKWMSELRDHLGVSAFDKLFSSLTSYVPSSHGSKAASSNDRSKKKSMDAISKLIEKAQALAIDVSSYTTPLNELLLKGVEAQAEASAILMNIGCLSGISTSGDSDDGSKSNSSAIEPTIGSQRELGDLTQASNVLERIDAFPFIFEEGLNLANIVEGEKNWAARVRDCIPPRQSRKKRQANDTFTTEQLHELLNESRRLRFLFPEELRILAKELEDLTAWRAKAHQAIDEPVKAVSGVARRLQSFDELVYGKLQKAKKKLHIGDVVEADSAGDVNMDVSSELPESETVVQDELKTNDTPMEVDAEGPAEETESTENVKPEQSESEIPSKDVAVKNGTPEIALENAKQILTNGLPVASAQVLEIHVDSIMTHVRIESGCSQKASAKDEDDADPKASWMMKNGRALLEPVLAMTEQSLDSVNSLELKEAEARQTVEDLALADEKGGIAENVTEECVRALEAWKARLVHVQEESDVLSVTTPEQKALGLVISLLEWLQGSRSIFYDEILPLQALVAKGNSIADDLKAMRSLDFVKPATFETLEQMLWPLPYLKAHEKVMLAWIERVRKCVADKHARVEELQALLDNGSGLLLEQDAFRIVLDEAKRARIWLSKLKKRLKGLISKGVGRLSMNAARSLVEEGEDLAIDIPVFDFLKEHLDIASDWENRVLGSGIESGQARVSNLLALLNEYECARLVIDLDMHRDVLKSATERYCICRQPFDGLMIGCDHCDEWFHDSCIGMSKEKAEKVEHYTCPSCTILQELQSVLQRVKTGEQQSNLWDMQEYAKSFEKQHASALRKIKREEKTIERTEMQLYSCSNQMKQLRTRIEETERAKACLNIAPMAANGSLGQQPVSTLQRPATAQTPAKTSSAPIGMAVLKSSVSAATRPAAVGASSLLLAAAAVTAATTASTSASSSTASGSTSALVGGSKATPQHPTILIPSVQLNNYVQKSVSAKAPEVVPALKAEPGGKTGAMSASSVKASGASEGTSSSKTVTPAAPSTTSTAPKISASAPLPAASASLNPKAVSTIATTTSTSVTSSIAATTPATSSSATLSTAARAQVPTLLNPMAATLMGPTERLAALVMAGGVEQQLSKMKGEHVEASRRVQELQDSLRLSRDRLTIAQQALRDLTEVFHARHRMLPYAQAWVRQAVSLLNTTALLSGGNLNSSTFLPPEYAAALAELTRPAPTPTTTPLAASVSTSIEKLFPGVRVYSRTLRAVAWSQVVVALLVERPARSDLSHAILYATRHELWDDKKTLAPLRCLIGRVDTWVSRIHKCMSKTSNKAQQLSKLKVLMNEYSKLPLTYTEASGPLNVYVKHLADGGAQNKTKTENGAPSSDPVEFAARKALIEAMSRCTASTSASGASEKAKQPPRKRKAYTRKDKAPVARTVKKAKTPITTSAAATTTASTAPSRADPAPTPKVVHGGAVVSPGSTTRS